MAMQPTAPRRRERSGVAQELHRRPRNASASGDGDLFLKQLAAVPAERGAARCGRNCTYQPEGAATMIWKKARVGPPGAAQ
jgi:hypothetical protein